MSNIDKQAIADDESAKTYYIHPMAFGSTQNPGYGHVAVVKAEDFEKLRTKLEAAENRIAELEAREVTLPPLNDDLIAILGRPNFTCSHLAELMRKSGNEIRRKSEHEQAAVIHWFLGLYLEHSDKWECIAKDDIQARVAMLNASRPKGE